MANPSNFTITRHAMDRLIERCQEFANQVVLIPDAALRLREAYKYINEAAEEKRFLNNSIFMTKLYEKHGFENDYTLFVRDNNVFVGISNQRGQFIVTVLTKNSHYLPHICQKIKKFEKKPEKLSSYFPSNKRKA